MSDQAIILREKSIDAFLLALETINKITVRYRAEAFTFLFCNAWELLCKAELCKRNGPDSIRRKAGSHETFSLQECLNRLFPSSKDPIRLNVEYVKELRDNAMHLTFPFTMPMELMALFQAGVLNYVKLLREWTGEEISNRVPLGMMALVYDLDPTKCSLHSPLVQKEMSPEVLAWLQQFQSRADQDGARLGAEDLTKFRVSVTLKLALVKNPDKADVILRTGQTGAVGPETILVEVPKDPDRTHPYRGKELIEQINRRCSPIPKINPHDVLCVRRLYKLESKPEFYYKSRFGSPQYSDSFVNWLVEQFTKDSEFFKKSKQKYKALAAV